MKTSEFPNINPAKSQRILPLFQGMNSTWQTDLWTTKIHLKPFSSREMIVAIQTFSSLHQRQLIEAEMQYLKLTPQNTPSFVTCHKHFLETSYPGVPNSCDTREHCRIGTRRSIYNSEFRNPRRVCSDCPSVVW